MRAFDSPHAGVWGSADIGRNRAHYRIRAVALRRSCVAARRAEPAATARHRSARAQQARAIRGHIRLRARMVARRPGRFDRGKIGRTARATLVFEGCRPASPRCLFAISGSQGSSNRLISVCSPSLRRPSEEASARSRPQSETSGEAPWVPGNERCQLGNRRNHAGNGSMAEDHQVPRLRPET